MADIDFEVMIVGGGVVGLAVAARLARAGRQVALCERHDEFGRETSSRNSEVVHAGLYYEPGSLKARLCVRGRRELYAYCAAADIPHRKCGKIVVAVSPEEEPRLQALYERGRENGVEGLELVTAARVRALEPHVEAVAGLWSPESGIINAHALMHALAAEAEKHGAALVRGAEVLGLTPAGNGWRVRYRDSGGEEELAARLVINAAGLQANAVMRMAGLDPEAVNLRLHYCKGEYFSVQGAKRKLVERLVYPLPRANLVSLGIHTVVGLAGELKLGPSAFYVEEIDYRVDPNHLARFQRDVSAYLPFVGPEDLSPDMSGIRPKLSGPGEPARDFHVAVESAAAAPGFVNLVGIDSPGLTSCLALAAEVERLVRES